MATTWNPSDKYVGIVLSNSNLTASNPSVGAAIGVRSTNSPQKTAGKFHVEFTMNAYDGGASWAVGLSNGTPNLAGGAYQVGQTADSTGMLTVAGAFRTYANGAQVSEMTLAFAAGDIWAMEGDLDASRLWFQNVTRASGWSDVSNGFTGNPSAGTGGLDISSMSKTGGVMLLFTGNFTATAITATVNVGPSFALTPTAGFLAWDAVAPAGGAGAVPWLFF